MTWQSKIVKVSLCGVLGLGAGYALDPLMDNIRDGYKRTEDLGTSIRNTFYDSGKEAKQIIDRNLETDISRDRILQEKYTKFIKDYSTLEDTGLKLAKTAQEVTSYVKDGIDKGIEGSKAEGFFDKHANTGVNILKGFGFSMDKYSNAETPEEVTEIAKVMETQKDEQSILRRRYNNLEVVTNDSFNDLLIYMAQNDISFNDLPSDKRTNLSETRKYGEILDAIYNHTSINPMNSLDLELNVDAQSHFATSSEKVRRNISKKTGKDYNPDKMGWEDYLLTGEAAGVLTGLFAYLMLSGLGKALPRRKK